MPSRLRLLGLVGGSLAALARPASGQTCTGCMAASFAPAPSHLSVPSLPAFDQLPGYDGRAGVAAADLNADGFPDLALAAVQGVAVLLASPCCWGTGPVASGRRRVSHPGP